MNHLKVFVFMLMYIYILQFLIKSQNITAAVLISLLGINYIKADYTVRNYKINLRKALTRQRDFFINSLSHDLRIPTIAQIRALELVQSERFGTINETQKEMLGQIEDSCKYILNLLSLMINTYSLENNCYKLTYERFNLSEVIISCLNELSVKAGEKQIEIEYSNKIKNLYINADKTELKKVLINILSNSIANSHRGEKLSVITDLFEKNIRITIHSDTSRLYSGIYDNSSYCSVGQDIIMSFCKKMIENHKGKIIKTRTNNSFAFELPQYAT